jgi:acetyl esterase/lipase
MEAAGIRLMPHLKIQKQLQMLFQYGVCNLEYSTYYLEGGGWPGTFNDVANATDFIFKNSLKYNLDTSHFITYGHSAIGHLTLWLDARQKLNSSMLLYTSLPTKISRVFGSGAVADLIVFGKIDESTFSLPSVKELMGGTFQEKPERYSEGNPFNLIPLSTPVILITGDEHKIISHYLGDDYVKKAFELNDYAKHVIVPNSGHHEYNAPTTASWPYIIEAVDELMK